MGISSSFLTISEEMDLVNLLDDMAHPELIDHAGWRLWKLARTWRRLFEAEMSAAGHPWFTDARGGLIASVGKNGIAQSDLAARMELTKQAVQQLVDHLAAGGVVERRPDPEDKRSNTVHLTRKGRAVLAKSNTVKREIDARFAEILGRHAFDALNQALDRLQRALE